MRRNRRVKIVATLGPASNNEETMRRLFEAGADVFRVNMSHATHDGLRDIHAIVRKLELEFARPIGILVDLQGPKLRIGKFESGAIRLTEGDVLSFTRRLAAWAVCTCPIPRSSRPCGQGTPY
jgi:pyruvate kinase